MSNNEINRRQFLNMTAVASCLPASLVSGASGTASPAGQSRETVKDPSKRFSMPRTFPFYPAPPYRFRDNRLLFVTFKTTSEILRELVPEPLIPNPGNLAVVYVAHLNVENVVTGVLEYLEAAVLVPAVLPTTKAVGNYAVSLYLNTSVGIAAGREIWGFPKKDAHLTFVEKDGHINGRVERFGKLLLNVDATLQKKLEPGPDKPQTLFVEKIIPSARRNAPPDVWQLVSSTNVDNRTRETWAGTGKLELATGPEDPLGRIEVLETVGAQLIVTDFTMDYGEVLHDYLAKK